MKAMRTGEVATVTPFRYSRLLFGIALGVLVFGERVDAVMAAGCAVVVASGLVIQHRTSRAELQAATTDVARP
jgi:drug/metabolite transporter (DMT)-like permease